MTELYERKSITPRDEDLYRKILKSYRQHTLGYFRGTYHGVMAATRKLQSEIDRCLKKVSEGVELFEEVWTKVHYATNSNQKDKYESDLKKEIKKLQRLRDQIKVWIASTEIKDKSLLIETRKLIETQMERFKVVERETKTKAYSKEGLGLITKCDPITRERDELNSWLINTIDNIQVQIDAFECDIESLSSSKKKKLDKERYEKVDLFRRVMEKHKFHIGKLELILRTLDNITNEEKLPEFLSQVKKIKEDVDYYLESAQDPEYEENEYLYDDIECLDDILGSGIGSSTISPNPTPVLDTNPSTPTTTGRYSPTMQSLGMERQHDIQQYESSFPERRNSYTEEGNIVKPMPVKPSPSGSVGGYGAKVPRKKNVSPYPQSSTEIMEPCSDVQSEPQTINDGKKSITPSTMEGVDQGQIDDNDNPFVSELEGKKRNRHYSGQEQKYVTPIPGKATPPFASVSVPLPSEPMLEGAHSSNGLSHHYVQGPGSSEQSENGSGSGNDRECSVDLTSLPNSANSNCNNMTPSPSVISNSSNVVVLHPKVLHSEPPQSETTLRNERVPDVSYAHAMQLKSLKELEALRASAGQSHLEEHQQRQEESVNQQQPVNHTPHLTPAQEQLIMEQYIGGGGDAPDQLTTLKSMAQEVMTRAGLNFSADQRAATDATTSAHIPPMLGVAPLGPVPLHPSHDYQLSMLEAAHYHLPCLADSEPLRQYLPRNPVPTPNYYPQTPLVHSDSLEFFGRMSIETLFFIFYYLEGTRAQYMAAKVLKKQSWRFHTKFMMWFQRHEEPKVINEVYEQGTYIYFDIEKWGQRKKDGFVFEYQYLEDRDLN